MISGINSEDTSLMQYLISASKGLSGTAQNAGTTDASGAKGSENGFLNCLNENFSKLDSNGDNTLSKDEIQSFMKQHLRHMGPPPGMFIENMDSSTANKADGSTDTQGVDGGSKKSEHSGFKAAIDNFMSKLDANQDGKISTDELTSAIDKGVGSYSTGKINALSEAWQKFSDSDLSKKLLDQFSKKLSEVYNSSMASDSLHSVTNLVT